MTGSERSVPRRTRVLVCDDEEVARRAAIRALGARRFSCVECSDGQACLEAVAAAAFDVILLDLRMPGMDGMTTLERLRGLPEAPPVIVLTADASLRSAIDAVKAGAADFVAKPYEIEELRLVVVRTVETQGLRRENARLRAELRQSSGTPLGASPAMQTVAGMVERVAPTAASVLITGETGTGKELIARQIHDRSAVAAGPFVTLNCAAIPTGLLESELFGHRRGAFTGADQDRSGRFVAADGGTLFLDEIGDMPLEAQAKLLRVLQDGVVEPLGGGKPVEVDVRLLAATHRDLRQRVGAGEFREDLLYRLRVVELPLPPLRERGDDVVLLARHFLAGVGARPLQLDPEAEAALVGYPWPGNVRELRNAMERAGIFCSEGRVRLADLPAELRGAAAAPAVAAMIGWDPADDFATAKKKAIERFERAAIGAALERSGGNVSQAARDLGLFRQSLQQKIRELGVNAEEFGAATEPK